MAGSRPGQMGLTPFFGGALAKDAPVDPMILVLTEDKKEELDEARRLWELQQE